MDSVCIRSQGGVYNKSVFILGRTAKHESSAAHLREPDGAPTPRAHSAMVLGRRAGPSLRLCSLGLCL